MRCIRPFDRMNSVTRRILLGHLAADFAARIGFGVDVDIVLAGHQIGGLGIGQRRAALGGARRGVRDRDRNAGVLAGFGGSVEMRGGGGAGKAGIGQLPGQLLGGGVVIDIGGAGAGAGVRRALRICRPASPSTSRRMPGRRRQRPPERKRGKHRLGSSVLSLLTSDDVRCYDLKTMTFRVYSRNRPERRKISCERFGWR